MPKRYEEVKPKAFGYELLLDLYDCKPGVCDDLNLCYRFLDNIVADLGMEKQSPPSIFFTDAKRFPDKAGLSGWAPLVESSVVIHTLSPKNFITIDVYCCRYFEQQKALGICREYFSPGKVEKQFLYRGINYYNAEIDRKRLLGQALVGSN